MHVEDNERTLVKGTVPRDFLPQVFYMDQFPPKPLIIPLGPFPIFSKIHWDIYSSRCTTGVVGHRWQKEKSSIRRFFIFFFWTPLGIVELAYRWIFFFKFILKVHKHEIILNFFLSKSNPYMPFENFRKKILFFSFDFRQNFDVRTFPRWLSIRGTKFFWEISKKFFSSKSSLWSY